MPAPPSPWSVWRRPARTDLSTTCRSPRLISLRVHQQPVRSSSSSLRLLRCSSAGSAKQTAVPHASVSSTALGCPREEVFSRLSSGCFRSEHVFTGHRAPRQKSACEPHYSCGNRGRPLLSRLLSVAVRVPRTCPASRGGGMPPPHGDARRSRRSSDHPGSCSRCRPLAEPPLAPRGCSPLTGGDPAPPLGEPE